MTNNNTKFSKKIKTRSIFTIYIMHKKKNNSLLLYDIVSILYLFFDQMKLIGLHECLNKKNFVLCIILSISIVCLICFRLSFLRSNETDWFIFFLYILHSWYLLRFVWQFLLSFLLSLLLVCTQTYSHTVT